ncbi:MAG: flavodoxin domain-containing protein [Coprococcus sp.]
MNKIVVIYDSKYGSTRRYALWIAEALACQAFEKKTFAPGQLSNYDTIIYGGGLYAGGVSGISLLTENFDKLKDKNVILFTCGLADPTDPDNVSHIREGLAKVLTPEMLNIFHLFHLRGAIDYSRLNLVHKAMMAMLHKAMLKKDYASLRKEDQLMLDTYGQKVDFTDKNTIAPIIDMANHPESPLNLKS